VSRLIVRTPKRWVLIDRTQIARVGFGEPPQGADEILEVGDAHILPGFIDVHVHGAVGRDTMDADPDSLLAMARFYAQHGVTSFFPTTMTAPHEKIVAALKAVREVMGKPTGGARIYGAHLEGPYINAAMIGAQNPAYARRATPDETRELLDLGVIQRITLAPEFAENHAFIRDAAAHGIAVSAGHTQATPDDLRAAIALGLLHTTHTFNAMTALHHRNPGTVGAALAFDQLTCELISDTIHVHPLVMKILARAKASNRVILITDAMAGAGMPDGQYDLGGLAVTVGAGQARLTDGGALAGSVLTYECGVANFAQAIGKDWDTLSDYFANNAAASHPNLRNKGQIYPGRDADITVVSPGGQVLFTIVVGEVVYNHSLDPN